MGQPVEPARKRLTQSAQETEADGARWARVRPNAADAFATIQLSGDLGAGKTTWARGFLGASGVRGSVKSPTYTLVELYELGAQTLVHMDLYRLRDPSELEHLGITDWAAPGYLWLIEWPERGRGRLPIADLEVRFTARARGHEITISAATLLGRDWCARAEA